MTDINRRACMVVLSGGQDSTTCLFWAMQRYTEVHAICFDYGQKHSREIEAAVVVAKLARVHSFSLVDIKDVLVSSSPLVDANADLETYSDYASMDRIIGNRVEKTFVPMRNALFLTIAANRAVARGIRTIITGVCQADGANYPDCRRDFITAQETAICRAIDGYVYIETPLMFLSKAESIKLAKVLPGCWEALAYTHTAYDGSYPPTSKDHASVLRAHGFEQAHLPDPLVLRAHSEGLMPLPDTANYRGQGVTA